MRKPLTTRIYDWAYPHVRHFCIIGWRKVGPAVTAVVKRLYKILPSKMRSKMERRWQETAPKRAWLKAELMEWFYPPNWADSEYVHNPMSAAKRGPRPETNRLFAAIVLFFVFFLLWASLADLEEVSRGEGKIIPSSSVQKISNLEGGIVQEILVRTGDIVEKDQVLMRLDDTGFASSVGEQRKKMLSLKAAIARLTAEVNDSEPVWPEDVAAEAPEILDAEKSLYKTRQAELDSTVGVMRQQAAQKTQEVRELQNKMDTASKSLASARQEYDMTLPLLEKGIIPKVEVLRLERQVQELEGEVNAARLAIPRAQSGANEVQSRVREQTAGFRAKAAQELADRQEQIGRFSEAIKASEDKVSRTLVKSPMKGIVKQIMVGTIGGVFQPGQDLMEIVPLEDTLLVEAQIRPQDVAFLRPGQNARVRLSAYDYTIYGALDATLENISADTITDEKGDSFYLIRVRTNQSYLGDADNPLPIMPGMVATVDILTGEKSVLSYLLKPVLKARERAMRER